MSVLIKGLEMPTDCIVCPFGWNGCNNQHDFVYMGSRPSDCPLIELPPHGDLIDRDELRQSFRESIDECHNWANKMREAENEEMVIRAEQSLGTFVECSLRAKNAPTIIEAEEEAET